MKTTQKNVWNNSRSSEKQGGKGEHRTDTTPKPEIGKKQREQQQGAKQAQPNSCKQSPTSHEPVGLYFFVAFYCEWLLIIGN